MSKKDYELIASVIESLSTITSKADIGLAFVAALQKTNPGFKPDMFLEACGLVVR